MRCPTTEWESPVRAWIVETPTQLRQLLYLDPLDHVKDLEIHGKSLVPETQAAWVWNAEVRLAG